MGASSKGGRTGDATGSRSARRRCVRALPRHRLRRREHDGGNVEIRAGSRAPGPLAHGAARRRHPDLRRAHAGRDPRRGPAARRPSDPAGGRGRGAPGAGGQRPRGRRHLAAVAGRRRNGPLSDSTRPMRPMRRARRASHPSVPTDTCAGQPRRDPPGASRPTGRIPRGKPCRASGPSTSSTCASMGRSGGLAVPSSRSPKMVFKPTFPFAAMWVSSGPPAPRPIPSRRRRGTSSRLRGRRLVPEVGRFPLPRLFEAMLERVSARLPAPFATAPDGGQL